MSNHIKVVTQNHVHNGSDMWETGDMLVLENNHETIRIPFRLIEYIHEEKR